MTKGLTLVSESMDVAWALSRAAITIGRYLMLKNIVTVAGGRFKNWWKSITGTLIYGKRFEKVKIVSRGIRD